MKHGRTKTHADRIIVLGCIVFALLTLGAVGESGRRRAKERVCLSNLHQWGAMFEMFVNDNNGYFMEGYAGSSSGHNRWIRALGAYHEYDTNFSCCPEATSPWYDVYGNDMGLEGTGQAKFSAWGYYRQSGWAKPMKGSYGISGWCNNPEPGHHFGGKPERYHWRTPDVRGADGVALFLDAQRYNMWPELTDAPPAYDGQHWSGSGHMTRACVNRHAGATNALFMDWSVREVGLKELWTLKWHREFNTAGPWTRAGGVLPSDWPAWMRQFKDY